MRKKKIDISMCMLTRKIFVGFFILLFCFQLVPVNHMGSVLFGNQIIEETFQDQESEQARFPDDSVKHIVSGTFLFFQHNLSREALIFEKAITVLIITRISDDVQTPPPNNIG